MINTFANLLVQQADSALEVKYAAHLAKFGISYGTPEEYNFRFGLFAAKDAEYETINADETHTFKVGHNKFSTMTADEAKKFMGRMPTKSANAPTMMLDGPQAATVDWRTKGAVNPVQDQGQCGSCWAFSSTAALEGAHFIKTGTLLKLSESQFVDCSAAEGNEGCNGGLEMYAFDYAEKTPLELEADYPYVARTRSCKATAAKEAKGVEAKAYQHVQKKSVPALKAAIEAGPTCVAVDAANNYFQGYTSGILNTTKCGTDLDHAITAVGYGEESGKGYFIVRNSWGASWGEAGYIRMSSDVSGAGVCGILMDSTAVQAAD